MAWENHHCSIKISIDSPFTQSCVNKSTVILLKAYSIDREAIATAFQFTIGSVREMIATDQWNKIVCTKYLTVHIISAIQQ